jgi:hypothetical protein
VRSSRVVRKISLGGGGGGGGGAIWENVWTIEKTFFLGS